MIRRTSLNVSNTKSVSRNTVTTAVMRAKTLRVEALAAHALEQVEGDVAAIERQDGKQVDQAEVEAQEGEQHRIPILLDGVLADVEEADRPHDAIRTGSADLARKQHVETLERARDDAPEALHAQRDGAQRPGMLDGHSRAHPEVASPGLLGMLDQGDVDRALIGLLSRAFRDIRESNGRAGMGTEVGRGLIPRGELVPVRGEDHAPTMMPALSAGPPATTSSMLSVA